MITFLVGGDKHPQRRVSFGISVEPIRVDDFAGKRFTVADPDGLPIEFYERMGGIHV